MTHAEKAVLAYDMNLLSTSEVTDLLASRVTRFSNLASALVVTVSAAALFPYTEWLYLQVGKDPILAFFIAAWVLLVLHAYLGKWIAAGIYATRPRCYFRGHYKALKEELAHKKDLLRAIRNEVGPFEQFATLQGLSLQSKATIIAFHDRKRVGMAHSISLIRDVQACLDYRETHIGQETCEMDPVEKRFRQISEIYAQMPRRVEMSRG